MKEAIVRFTTEALVVKEQAVGENDRLVTLFTRDRGMIRAFASGARCYTNKKSSATSLLTYSAFGIAKRRDTYKIYEAQPIRVFFSLGADIQILALAQYFCEISMKMVPDEEPNDEFLRLILNSLHFLGDKEKNPVLIKAVTELRAAAISGFLPDLVACENCGRFEDTVMYFDLKEGRLLCHDCQTSEVLLPLNATVLSAMRHIVYSKFQSVYAFSIPEQSAADLSAVTEQFLSVQTEHRFQTLEFYHSVAEPDQKKEQT